MEMPMQSLRFELPDFTDSDLLNEFLTEIAVRYTHWISDYVVSETNEGAYASILANNGNDDMWHRLRQGDHLMFLGKDDPGIPGIKSMSGITQVVSSPQQTASEAIMADMMGLMGLPGPTEIGHAFEAGFENGDDPDQVMGDLFGLGEGEERNAIMDMIKGIIDQVEEGNDD